MKNNINIKKSLAHAAVMALVGCSKVASNLDMDNVGSSKEGSAAKRPKLEAASSPSGVPRIDEMGIEDEIMTEALDEKDYQRSKAQRSAEKAAAAADRIEGAMERKALEKMEADWGRSLNRALEIMHQIAKPVTAALLEMAEASLEASRAAKATGFAEAFAVALAEKIEQCPELEAEFGGMTQNGIERSEEAKIEARQRTEKALSFKETAVEKALGLHEALKIICSK